MKTRILIMMLLSAPVLTGGCAVVGPYSISNGRMAYSEMINYTEDQQLLNAIVRERHGQTFGMLSVSSVAANVKFRGSAGAEFNAWGSNQFTDKLMPLSLKLIVRLRINPEGIQQQAPVLTVPVG